MIPETGFHGQYDISDDELAAIGAVLNMKRGFNLSVYKDSCMKRRVSIRIRAVNCRTAAEYCNLLRREPGELDLLQKALTIHVSQFFRNPDIFETLRLRVLPSLFAACLARETPLLRACSMGCAGGEEPYSLAILLRDYFGKELRSVRADLQAIDIDEGTLALARQGLFPEDRLKELTPEQRNRHFRRQGVVFRLAGEIARMVEFRRGDLTDIADMAPCDLILCRNTLIYFTRRDQEKIQTGIADNLTAGGILVLGKSETLVGSARRRFEAVCPIARIYRRV